MGITKVVKSTCELCNEGCGVLIHMEKGRPVGIEGDPEDPVSRGAICVKGTASLELLDNPRRLRYPVRRRGKRGEGRWERVSWDEAYEVTASALTRAKEDYGPESVVFIRGCAKGYQDSYLARFANVFGTPNVASMAPVCYVPRHSASQMTYGFMAFPDYEHPPALILAWAVNTRNTAAGEWKRAVEAMSKGARALVIDPWESEFARVGGSWVKPRPCTDLALALGMMHIIISEDLYDREFVDRWTSGFDQLREHVKTYTPEMVSEITWVAPQDIEGIAREYATTKPAVLVAGNGIDNNINNFQCARAFAILRALTGNLGRPGGDVQWSPSGIVPKGHPELNQQDSLSAEMRAKRLDAGSGLMPNVFYALPQSIVEAVTTGAPYPVKAVYMQGASLLHSYPDTKRTFQALNSLDFVAATDFFMTPTAEMADIVFPAATFLEIDSLHEGEYMPAATVIQKVAEVGECRSDYQILAGLAETMGLGGYFWKQDVEILDYILKPTGLTFEGFREIGVVSGAKQYGGHEKTGFSTPSGKVELYSSKLAGWGFDPLPGYIEPPETPVSDPDLAKEYPLIMTNRKCVQYQHSGGRQTPSLREMRPAPIVHIHKDTARELGIEDNDMVYIETLRSRIQQQANLVESIDPRVVIVDYGWWFPEKGPTEDLHGAFEANINVLTCGNGPKAKELGSPTLRGIAVKVYKAG